MNPIAVVLLLVGYLLVAPIGTQMKRVVDEQNRLALTAHQFGIGIVCVGWVVGNRPRLIWIHVLWAIIAVIWFNVRRPSPAP